MGVDSFVHSWATPEGQEPPLLYANPPFGQIGRVLRKVIEERPDCLLILPVWPRGWRALLHSLPIRARWLLPHVPDLCIPGPAVPNVANRRPMAPPHGSTVCDLETGLRPHTMEMAERVFRKTTTIGNR